MSTENRTIEQLEAENEKLKSDLSALKKKESDLSVQNTKLDYSIHELNKEKDRLLDIIENLSLGIMRIEKNK